VRVIEVFADVVCPFTHAGLRRLVARRSELHRDDVLLRVRAWPLELVNGRLLAADMAAEQVAALRGGVAPDLFSGFDPGRFPRSSLPALALAAEGYAAGPAVGEAISLALRTALFEEGRDIGDLAVLVDIAARHGVAFADPEGGREAVMADWTEGRDRGVIGSPHFFIDGTDVFCPTLDIRRVGGSFEISLDTAGYAEFIHRCFGDEGR